MTQITYAQIAEVALDSICRDPEMLGAAFLAASEPDESGNDASDDSVRSLLDACKKRNIDPAAAIRGAIERRQQFMNLFTDKRVKVTHSPREFRMPIQIKAPGEQSPSAHEIG